MEPRRVVVAVLVAVSAVLGLGPLAGPAAAAGPSRADAKTAGDGVVALQSEVLALVELRAWPDPVPRRLLDVHDAYASYVEGLSRAALVDWVLSADRDGARVLARMRSAGDRPTQVETTALGALSSAARQALRSGDRFPLPAEVYVHALDDLDARAAGDVPVDGGTDPGARPGPVPAAGATQPSAEPTPSASAPTAAPTASPTAAPTSVAGSPATVDRGVPVAAVAAVLALVLVGGAVLAARRRRPSRVMSARHVVGLLDAGRLLSQARDVPDVASVAVVELARLLRGAGSLLVAADPAPDGTWPVLADPTGVLAPSTVADGVLARVAATGQGAVQVLEDDPCLGARAVVAVPVLVSGGVRAVLAAVRPAGQPFGVDDLRVAAELAPLVASALQGAAALEDVRAQAGRDALTGLPNRRSLDADLQDELGRDASRATAVVMVDVDHFKAFNDREGHAGGDLALRAVAQALAGRLREQDGAYRYGGEEFCLLLRQVTREETAGLLDGVLDAVRAIDVPGAARQPAGHLSVSAGVAFAGDEQPAEAVRRADEALYRAKEQGRDRYEVAPAPDRSLPPGPRRGADDRAASPGG